ncbi:MAG: ATP-binding cassette domain-containing protein [Chitinispirillaceae bacterium]|nr:ATP-binding cassette domain-containing protein [Chitinispirillaceae bacterium]
MEEEKILEVFNATVMFKLKDKEHGYIKAVDDVSFALNKGSVLGLVGESGSGKTTLGRAIALFQPLTSGKILFEDRDITLNKSKEYRRHIQMIFQNPYSSLNPRMTIGEAISEGVRGGKSITKKEALDITSSLLEQVGLESAMINRYPHEFSGGQRQRVAIARALSVKPSLLIADEPVSSLDVSVAAQIINLFSELRSKLKLTIIFISHDLAIVKYLCDFVAVMYKGKIVEYGTKKEIFTHPSHPYTQSLLRSVPSIKPLLTSKTVMV